MFDRELKNPNAFQPDEHQLNTGVRSAPVGIRCPHCRHVASFAVVNDDRIIGYTKAVEHPKLARQFQSETFTASIRRCPNPKCSGFVFVIQLGSAVIDVQPPELLDFDPEGLPPALQKTLSEAVACHGAGSYRAAAMMVAASSKRFATTMVRIEGTFTIGSRISAQRSRSRQNSLMRCLS